MGLWQGSWYRIAALARRQGDAFFQQVFVDVDDAAAGKILSNWYPANWS